MKVDVITHYDLLVDEGNDPVCDPEPLKQYMDKWDGKPFIDALRLDKSKSVLEIGVGTGRLAVKTAPLCKCFTGIIGCHNVIFIESVINNRTKFIGHLWVPDEFLKCTVPKG